MINYKTVQEKASEWKVSVRQVQNLCNKGEIKGTIKKAGAWFIPEHTPKPEKNAKTEVKRFHFTGTKKKIFESSIELFTLNGYDSVSIRDIADAVGVTQSSLYNHFKSKQEILDTIYDYYCDYHQKNRPSLEDIDPVLMHGSLLGIITSVWHVFEPEYITKIILQRTSVDERAREITKKILIDSGIEFMEAVFKRAVEIGRLAPFDTYAMAFFINSIRTFTLHIWIVDSSEETMKKVTKTEMQLYQYATRLLTDLQPPSQ